MKYINNYTVCLTYTHIDEYGNEKYYSINQHTKDGGEEWRATLECEGHNGRRVTVDLSNDGSPSGLEKLNRKIECIKRDGSPHGKPYTLIRKPYLATFPINEKENQ